jgi:hypothetical protein
MLIPFPGANENPDFAEAGRRKFLRLQKGLPEMPVKKPKTLLVFGGGLDRKGASGQFSRSIKNQRRHSFARAHP